MMYWYLPTPYHWIRCHEFARMGNLMTVVLYTGEHVTGRARKIQGAVIVDAANDAPRERNR